jgi:hypothetical protein
VVAFQPPLWVQFATVFPALLAGCLGTLRPVKAWLVAEQYIHKASEAAPQRPEAARGRPGEGGADIPSDAPSKNAERRIISPYGGELAKITS